MSEYYCSDFVDEVEKCRTYEDAYKVYLKAKALPEFECWDYNTDGECTLEKTFQSALINVLGCRVVDSDKKTNTEADNAFLEALKIYTNKLDERLEPFEIRFGDVSLHYYPRFGWTYVDGHTWLSSNC